MSKEVIKGSALLLILATGIVLQKLGIIDLSGLVSWIESYSHRWWAPVVLVSLMIILYAFALPGSTLMLAAGVMYPPLWATGWSLLGGVLGGLAAYYLVRFLSADAVRRYADSALFNVLKQHAGFLLLSALRMLPGFPHSVINYSAGILRVPRLVFVASSALGHAVKAFVYTSAVYHATHIESEEDAFSMQTLWPLVAMSALLVLGYVARKRLFTRGTGP